MATKPKRFKEGPLLRGRGLYGALNASKASDGLDKTLEKTQLAVDSFVQKSKINRDRNQKQMLSPARNGGYDQEDEDLEEDVPDSWKKPARALNSSVKLLKVGDIMAFSDDDLSHKLNQFRQSDYSDIDDNQSSVQAFQEENSKSPKSPKSSYLGSHIYRDEIKKLQNAKRSKQKKLANASKESALEPRRRSKNKGVQTREQSQKSKLKKKKSPSQSKARSKDERKPRSRSKATQKKNQDFVPPSMARGEKKNEKKQKLVKQASSESELESDEQETVKPSAYSRKLAKPSKKAKQNINDEDEASDYSDFETVDLEAMKEAFNIPLEEAVEQTREEVAIQMQARIFRQSTLAKFLNNILNEMSVEATWSVPAREFYAQIFVKFLLDKNCYEFWKMRNDRESFRGWTTSQKLDHFMKQSWTAAYENELTFLFQ